MLEVHKHYMLIINNLIKLTLLLGLFFHSCQNLEDKNEINKLSNDAIFKVGNCFYYKENEEYFGVIIVTSDSIHDEYNVALLDKSYKSPIDLNQFKRGYLIYQKINITGGAEGIWSGFFMREDFSTFRKKFTYIGKLSLDNSKIEVNGGGELIFSKNVNIRNLYQLNYPYPNTITQYSKPVSDFLESESKRTSK